VPVGAPTDEIQRRLELTKFHTPTAAIAEPNAPANTLGIRRIMLAVEDIEEWTGTKITFEIARKGDDTEVSFAHLGLSPELECFESCSSAWGFTSTRASGA
jgi:hypothetical protein